MKQEIRKKEYEIPRIDVRGIVLEGGMAAPVSVLTGSITQDTWSATDTPLGADADADGDIWIAL
jgi:hypothetical protein